MLKFQIAALSNFVVKIKRKRVSYELL